MINQPFTKAQKSEIRRLAGLAHERELARAVELLQVEINRWRDGEIDVFILNENIHGFHNGISRDLCKTYSFGQADWNVASAIARGILQESEVDSRLLKLLQGSVEFARQNLELPADAANDADSD